MITKLSRVHATVEVNEYIEKFSEVQSHLDLILEFVTMEEIRIINYGCNQRVINKMVKYIQDHDDKVELWLNCSNANFGMVKPIDLIRIGRGNKVLLFIDSALAGH